MHNKDDSQEEAMKAQSSNTDPHSAPWALITGASSGLGAIFSRIAAESGLVPVIVARREDALRSVAEQIRTATGCEAIVRAADLSDPQSVYRLADDLLSERGTPAVLVNNAGFGAFGSMLEEDEAVFERMISLNAATPLRLSLRIGRAMRAAGGGRILNVASTAAFQPCPYLGVYGATKAFLLSVSEALAQELDGSGVTVTALCPGPTRTNFGTAAGLQADSPFDRYAADAEAVARFGWQAMMKGKPVAVEGTLNRIGALAAQLAPRAFVRRIAAKLLVRMQ